jgi:hypothetical protein
MVLRWPLTKTRLSVAGEVGIKGESEDRFSSGSVARVSLGPGLGFNL